VPLSNNDGPRRPRNAARTPQPHSPIASRVPNHRAGAVTLKDVAALAKVSTATVSHVINNTRRVKPETQSRVLAAIGQLGYSGDSVARSLRRGQTAILGLVVSDIENPFFAVLASHVQRAAALRGYQVIFANSAEQADRERESIDAMRAQRVDGIILAPVAQENAEFLSRQGTPLVLVNRQFPDVESFNVVVDDFMGATLGFDHLWELGHREIVTVHGNLDRSTTVARLAGVRDSYLRRGVGFDEALLIDAGYTGSSGEAALTRLLKRRRRPTAILALSNWSVLAAVRALGRGAVRCPDDVSLVGVGATSPYWMPSSSISMVVLPLEQMANAAVQLLLDELDHVPDIKSILLRPSFSPGLSSAPIARPSLQA